jgi:hypothetical protein
VGTHPAVIAALPAAEGTSGSGSPLREATRYEKLAARYHLKQQEGAYQADGGDWQAKSKALELPREQAVEGAAEKVNGSPVAMSLQTSSKDLLQLGEEFAARLVQQVGGARIPEQGRQAAIPATRESLGEGPGAEGGFGQRVERANREAWLRDHKGGQGPVPRPARCQARKAVEADG